MEGTQPTPRGPRYEPAVLLAAAFALGIYCDRASPHPMIHWWLLAIVCLSFWLLAAWRRFDCLASCLALLAVAATGGAWHHARWHLIGDDHIAAHIREESQPICLEAYVLSAPRIVPAPPATPLRAIPLGDRSRCEVEIQRVRDGRVWRVASGRSRLGVDGHLLGVEAGDTIRVYALYQRPTPALNPGEFDFADFERSEARWCNLAAQTPECISIIRTGSWIDARRWLDWLRLAGGYQLRRHLSPQRAALAAAVMLGEREFLDADRNERFLVTGTIHLLAISGLNLGILVYVFWVLGHTGLLSRRGTLAAAISFAVLYALLTDAEPPVLRAAVLITLYCVARWIGRPISSWQVLGGAALVVLAWNPAWLFHVGAQLSFLAVALLAWFQPLLRIVPPRDPLDRLLLQSRSLAWRFTRSTLLVIWQVVLTGAVVWVFSFPLVWRTYNLVSPVALLLNPLVGLPMAVALFSGFAVLVLGWLVPPLASVAGTCCDASLYCMESLIAGAEPLRHGYSWLPAPPQWWVAVFYLAMLLAAIWPACRPRRSWCLAWLCVWTAVALFLAMPVRSNPSSENPLRVTFVAVGHGTAILLELPDGRVMLYDCGRLGSPLSGARPISSVLWSRGITHLDAAVISHADSDHYNAFPEILERFSVGVVYVSTVMFNDLPPGVVALKEAVERHQIPLQTLRGGDRLRMSEGSGMLIEVLHPPRGGVYGSDNANSIVLLLEYCGQRILLTGDLEERGLADLMAEPALDVDVLMVPHHGSTRSNPQGLAAWCRPEHVVISGSRDFELGRDADVVARAFFAAGATVYHTSEHGAVQFEVSKLGLRATPQRLPPELSAEGIYAR